MLNLKENNIYDYIFLCNDEMVLKFKLYISSDDVSNIIKNYISKLSPCYFDVQSYKKVLNNTKLPIKLLPNLGKVGLKDKIFNTDSYLVPNLKNNSLELLLSDIYRCNFINLAHLNLILENLNSEDTLKKDISKKLLVLADLELVNIYDIKSGNLNVIVNDDQMSNGKAILKQILWVLTTSKQNLNLIEKLGLKDMFLDCAKNYNVKKKVK